MNKTDYEKWLQKGLEKGLTDIEIYATSNVSLSIDVYNQKVEKNEVSKTSSALIKGIYNGKIARVKVENMDLANVELMIDRLIDAASNITANEPAIIFEGSKHYETVDETVFDFTKVDPKEKVNLLLQLEAGIKANKYAKNVDAIAYSESESQTIIINSKGLNLDRHSTHATIYGVGVFEKDEQVKTGMGYQIVKNFNDINVDKIISDAINEGVSQLGAKPVTSKKYPIVFSNEMFGNILSVYSGIFTGEAAYRKLTKLVGKEDTVIASEIVNLVDDPFSDKALFKVPFDDEGVATQTRSWIKNGKFTDFAYNLKTAKIFNKESTGNGFTYGIGPSNLLLEPQDITFDEVIASINEGIYITDLVGLHAGVETVSGDFSLQAAGFKISEGKITDPVDMIVVSGNYFNLLKDIEMIANDFIFGLSGVGTGSVKIKELTVAGK